MTLSPIARLWQRLHQAAPQRCVELNPPASAAELRALAGLALPLPASFLDSLRVHNGELEEGALFPAAARLLPVSDMLEYRNECLQREAEHPDLGELDDDDRPLGPILGPVKPVLDSRQRLVFLRVDDLGLEYALDFDPAAGGHAGQVVRYASMTGGSWVVCADSFEAFMSGYVQALEQGEVADEPEGPDWADDEMDWDEEFDEEALDEDEDFLHEDSEFEDPLLEDEGDDGGLETALPAWPPLARVPALQQGPLDLATLRAAGTITGDWAGVMALVADPRCTTSETDRATLMLHAAADTGDSELGLLVFSRLAPDAINDELRLLQVELLMADDRADEAMTQLSLAIEATGSPRLRAQRARLYLDQSEESPYPDSPGQAMRWLAGPAGQQHAATCRDQAVEDLRAALAARDCIRWRLELAGALLESERWDEAQAVYETLLERLRARGEADERVLTRVREGLRQAAAREPEDPTETLQELEELVEQMDEMLGSLRGVAANLGIEQDPLDAELREMRDAMSWMIEQGTQAHSESAQADAQIDGEVEAIAQQLARLHADTPERFAEFSEAELDGPTRDWMDSTQAALEASGFRCLGTVEPVRNTEISGQCVPLRLLLSSDQRTLAALWRLEGPFSVSETVEIESLLADGRILLTNNLGSSNPFSPPPGIDQLALPLRTTPAALVTAHVQRLDAVGSAAQRLATLDDVLAVQEHQRLLKRQHAQQQGWISEVDLRKLLGGAYATHGGRVRARLQQLLG